MQKGQREWEGWGRAFLLHFAFHSGGRSRPPLPPAGLNLHRAFQGVIWSPYLSHPFKAWRVEGEGGVAGTGSSAELRPAGPLPSPPALGVPVKVTNVKDGTTHRTSLELFMYLNEVA